MTNYTTDDAGLPAHEQINIYYFIVNKHKKWPIATAKMNIKPKPWDL